jgi:hypothetical protein
MENLKTKKDYELLSIYKKLQEERKPIPMTLMNEINKRKLIKGYKGTFTSATNF